MERVSNQSCSTAIADCFAVSPQVKSHKHLTSEEKTPTYTPKRNTLSTVEHLSIEKQVIALYCYHSPRNNSVTLSKLVRYHHSISLPKAPPLLPHHGVSGYLMYAAFLWSPLITAKTRPAAGCKGHMTRCGGGNDNRNVRRVGGEINTMWMGCGGWGCCFQTLLI